MQKNTIVEPLTFDQWRYESDIESKYNSFHDEYGDLAGLLSDYKEYHYNEYLERVKRDGKYADLFVWQLNNIVYLPSMDNTQNWQSIAENKVKILLAISTLESLKYILEQGSVEHKFVCDTLTEIHLLQS